MFLKTTNTFLTSLSVISSIWWPCYTKKMLLQNILYNNADTRIIYELFILHMHPLPFLFQFSRKMYANSITFQKIEYLRGFIIFDMSVTLQRLLRFQQKVWLVFHMLEHIEAFYHWKPTSQDIWPVENPRQAEKSANRKLIINCQVVQFAMT